MRLSRCTEKVQSEREARMDKQTELLVATIKNLLQVIEGQPQAPKAQGYTPPSVPATPSPKPKLKRKHFSDAEKAEIFRLHSAGYGATEIADRIGRNKKSVWCLISRSVKAK